MPVKAHSVRTWPKPGEVFYPESDGKPMAENTEQFNWIVLLVENLKSLFADDPNVFVAGDLLWYPVQGRVDPDKHEFRAWWRQGDKLEPIEQLEGFQSPRLRVRFWPTSDGLKVERPDGTAFETHTEVLRRLTQERQRAERLAEKLRSLEISPD